ncbi:MAG: hypothetical protein V3S14_13110 [Anaerolineae bacterium]
MITSSTQEDSMISAQIQLTERQSWALQELAMKDRRKRAMDAVGRFRSGASDTSEQHDEYLAEVYGEWIPLWTPRQ